MIQVQVQPEFSEKLNHASTVRRSYPWDSKVIDWSVPIDDQHLYIPHRYSFLWGTPLWEKLALKEKSYVTRWEFTQLMRNAGAGEHLLNQAILSVLHHTNQYDPAWRYLLHEVAEECQHMAMFNEWVRLNPDIRTKGFNDDKWGLLASVLTPVFATQFPVFFWMLTMLLEVSGDMMGHDQANNELGLLHPVVVQLGKAHAMEEVRHIAFAKRWVEAAMPKLSKIDRLLLSEVAERVLAQVIHIGLPPIFYSSQIAPFVSYEEFRAAVRSENRREMTRVQVAPTVRQLHELGILRSRTLRKWEREGLVLPA